MVAFTTSSTLARSAESQLIAKPSPPNSLISLMVCSIGSRRRPVATTLTPRLAKQSAIPFPIPCPAPVTIATFSDNGFIFSNPPNVKMIRSRLLCYNLNIDIFPFQ